MDGTREDVVSEALSWEGTHYTHMGRVKIKRNVDGVVLDRGGVDCAQFPAAVYHAVGLIPEIPLTYYPRDWHLHRNAELYMREVLLHGRRTTDPKPGDFILFKVYRTYCHGAIVLDWPNVIHSGIDERIVCRALADNGQLRDKKRLVFTLWGE